MPTTLPLPNSITDKIEARTQAVRYKIILKEVRQFRAFCCDINSDGIMGVAKEPVAILDVSPNPVCLGLDIDWDLTDSYAPGSTINDWSVDFGDGDTPATGSDINTASGSHTYAAVGTYTITAYVEEGTGRNQTIEQEVTVIDCAETVDLGSYSYTATYGAGVFIIDWNADTPDWESRNLGLEDNALYVNSLVIKPSTKHLTDGAHELWIATNDGIYQSIDSGNTWAKLTLPDPSNLEFNDVTPATVDELTFRHIVFDPNNESVVFVIGSKENI